MSKFLDYAGLEQVIENLNVKFDKKVDKVSGKGLSTNDFTEEYKQKIDSVSEEIENKLDSSLKGAVNGIAELDENGKVPSNQLPSYVDDVIEGYFSDSKFYEESSHATEITGESGKIYVDITSGKTYRWSGSAFVVISETIALGETSSTAYRGDRGKVAYEHSQTAHAPADAEVNQNAFSSVKVGDNTVSANTKTDTITFEAGSNVTLSADTSGKVITISSTDTKITVDSSLSGTSTNPVQNKVVKAALDEKADNSHSHANATTSTAGFMSAADKTKLDSIEAITTEEITALFA